MIVAEEINNTALYGFHPDFVREENDQTPIHDEDLLTGEYQFDHHDSYLTGFMLSLVLSGMIAFVLMLFV